MDKKYIDKPGKYICTVKPPGNGWLDQKTKKDGTEGSPFIRIPCIVDMPESDQHGCEAVWYGYLGNKVSSKTGKTSRQHTEEKLEEVFGWKGSFEDDSSFDAFVGQKVRLQCDESEYNGNVSIKAAWLNPLATKREKNRDEYDKKRKSVLEQLKKDYPHLGIGGKNTPKTHDDEGSEIPF
jgi:hypothetical protein